MVDTTGIYLREIGRYPRLTQEKEIVFGRQVQKLMWLLSAKQKLSESCCCEPNASEWAKYIEISESDLKYDLQQGRTAKNKMIEANLRLVVAIAKKYQNQGLELLDLIQEGSIGLVRGVEKYDPAKGYRLSTYCIRWIRAKILAAIGFNRLIRLPVRWTQKLKQIEKVQQQLAQNLKKNPTLAEIASQIKSNPQEVEKCLAIASSPISIHMLVGIEQNIELENILAIDIYSQFLPENKCRFIKLKQILKKLTLQQQEVVNLRYGLGKEPPLSLSSVGKLMNLSRQRVCQIEHQALEQLRSIYKN